jgi:hypothetical protein
LVGEKACALEIKTFEFPPYDDNFDFFLEGVPVFTASQDTTRYAVTHHSEQDVMPEVQRREASVNEVVAAVLLYDIANDPQLLPTHQTHAEIDAEMKAQHYDTDFLKPFGLWDDWEKGNRGTKR